MYYSNNIFFIHSLYLNNIILKILKIINLCLPYTNLYFISNLLFNSKIYIKKISSLLIFYNYMLSKYKIYTDNFLNQLLILNSSFNYINILLFYI